MNSQLSKSIICVDSNEIKLKNYMKTKNMIVKKTKNDKKKEIVKKQLYMDVSIYDAGIIPIKVKKVEKISIVNSTLKKKDVRQIDEITDLEKEEYFIKNSGDLFNYKQLNILSKKNDMYNYEEQSKDLFNYKQLDILEEAFLEEESPEEYINQLEDISLEENEEWFHDNSGDLFNYNQLEFIDEIDLEKCKFTDMNEEEIQVEFWDSDEE